jgi:Zn-finger protein
MRLQTCLRDLSFNHIAYQDVNDIWSVQKCVLVEDQVDYNCIFFEILSVMCANGKGEF